MGDFVTYGVHYANDTLVFYRDGAAVRTVTSSCLVGANLNVVLSHELNPRLGGVNNGSTWVREPRRALLGVKPRGQAARVHPRLISDLLTWLVQILALLSRA